MYQTLRELPGLLLFALMASSAGWPLIKLAALEMAWPEVCLPLWSTGRVR